MLRKTVPVLLALFITCTASAHHGRRFLIVTEFRMPNPGSTYLVADYGAFKFDGVWAQEGSPGFLIAVGKQGKSAIEVHGHFEKEGAEPWQQEATGFEFRHQFTESRGWNFAAGIEAEIPKFGGKTAWGGQLIAGKEDVNGVIALNLMAENEEGLDGKTTWSYRAGWSPELKGRYGYSIEAAGSLEPHGAHELLFGVAAGVGENRLFKFGVGAGLTKESPDWAIHAGIVWKL